MGLISMDYGFLLFVLFCVRTASCQSISCSGVTSLSVSCFQDGLLCIVQTSNIDSSNAGRVQLCRNGVWGTIAENTVGLAWSEKNAQVACKQAGFSGAINTVLPLTISAGDTASPSMPVHLAGVRCRGSESSIELCEPTGDPSAFLNPSGLYTHISDAFVVCRPKSNDYSDVHVTNEQVGDLRLYGDPDNGEGVVEIYTSGFGWSSICPDGFENSDASVICSQFGYEQGAAMSYTLLDTDVRTSRFLYDTDCLVSGTLSSTSSMIRAGKCFFRIDLSSTCPSGASTYAGVRCSSSATEGDVRFFGGTNPVGGIVEVFYNNKWGMVCTRSMFALTEARTVCEQLNLEDDDAEVMSDSSLIDEESRMKPIWLAGMNCFTSHARFTDCVRLSSLPIGFGECRTSTLAASRCGQVSSGISSGAITGIVISVIFIIFFGIPFGYYLGKAYWIKRHQYGWYNTMTTPSNWCNSCTASTPRRNFNLTTTTNTQPTASINVEPAEPAVQFGGFTRESASAAADNNEPEQEPSFTKQAPPTYNISENFPSVSAPPPQDLPPPYAYPGSTPIGFAYPPPTAPPNNGQYVDAAYPPPLLVASAQPTAPPSAPHGGPGYPIDPAFPPQVGQLPYPVNLEVGGGAYPPPTFNNEPVN